MPSPNLPQEIQDSVIDHLYDDTRALKTASLVSGSWGRRACPLLFEPQTVTISIETANHQQKTEQLVQLLRSTTSVTAISNLAKYTKKLQIEGLERRVVTGEARYRDVPGTLEDYARLGRYLSELVPHFIAVTTLTVCWLRWDRLISDPHNPLSRFSSVETLTFDNVSFPTFCIGYKAMFGTIPTNRLKSTNLAGISAYNRAIEYSFPEDCHGVLQTLHSLTLDLDIWDEIRHPLLIPLISAPCNLHTLNLVVTTEGHIEMINRALKHLGSALKVLIFGGPYSSYVYNGWADEDNLDPLRLSVASNTQLEQLQLLGFELPEMPYIIDFLPNYLGGLLDSIQSTSLSELVFGVIVFQHVLDEFWSFEAVGQCLARPLSPLDTILAERVSAIPTVRILFEGAELPTWDAKIRRKVARKAAECLPNLHQNSQLAISIGGYPADFVVEEEIEVERYYSEEEQESRSEEFDDLEESEDGEIEGGHHGYSEEDEESGDGEFDNSGESRAEVD